jgi:cadherin 5 type 2 (VE-cadherin)
MEPYYPFKNSSVEDFTIGSESCEGHHVGYCNGPLKSGSTYRVKVRAFTAPDKFTDTHYSFPIQTGEFVSLRLDLNVFYILLYRCCNVPDSYFAHFFKTL